MNYTYVDIGVSDFDTSLSLKKDGETVLLVDPLAHYLDALPNGDGVRKIKAAIMEHAGTINVFHVPPPVINRVGLPYWVRGCNRVGAVHPAVVGALANLGIQESQAREQGIIQCTTCPCLSFSQLCTEADITSIEHLKIDTEGCDHIILASVLLALEDKLIPPPHSITFERIGYATHEHGFDPYGNCAILDVLARKLIDAWGYLFQPAEEGNTDVAPAGPNVVLVRPANT